MAITKEQILAEIRKKRAAKVQKETASKKPVVENKRVVAERQPRVIRETLNVQSKGPRTITEAINVRTAEMTEVNKKLYSQLAENIANATKVMTEATQAGAWTPGVVGQGAGVGLVKTYFDIFFGYFPNLIVHEIASTQPIKTEKAMVFFYESVAGSDKGGVAKGSKLITPFEINTNPEYTSNVVTVEADTVVRLWGPIIADSIKAFDASGAEKTLDGTVLKIKQTVSGNTINFENDGSDKTVIKTIQYSYSNKYAPTDVPELNANIDSREITAKARTIKTNYSFQAGFGFEAQFGHSLEEKLAEQAMYQLKRETDLDFVFEIMKSAASHIDWNKSAGVANGLYEFHKLSFRDAVVKASNKIFQDSKRVRGNVLLVGVNAQTIVETLPDFTGENYGSNLAGAKVIGKLKDIKVIAIPELSANDWAVIYKSPQDSLDAGIIFAPYIPVIATPTVMLDDFLARKAYTTSYGKLVVNNKYFVSGSIVDNPVAQPIVLWDSDGKVIEDFFEVTTP